MIKNNILTPSKSTLGNFKFVSKNLPISESNNNLQDMKISRYSDSNHILLRDVVAGSLVVSCFVSALKYSVSFTRQKLAGFYN